MSKSIIDKIGGLQRPSKMPCPSWSLSSTLCKTGSILREIPDSPCFRCYALKGRFTQRRVEAKNEDRLKAYLALGDTWPDHMASAIHHSTLIGDPYFRWFSSGDLQSPAMLGKIIEVAEKTPIVRHWLPTQERRMVRQIETVRQVPENLVIRISSVKLGSVLSGVANSSLVIPRTKDWASLVKASTPDLYYCPSSLQGGKCGPCRACWNPNVKAIAYLEH